MVNVLPYIFPLMLGRTFDLNKMKVGVDIFPKEVLDAKYTYQFGSTNSRYGLVENSDDARNLLRFDFPVSLRVKAGILNAGASGEYLSDHFHRRNTVDMVSHVKYISFLETLPDDPKPIPTWKNYGEALGTHYVYSITYGGEIITSVRFETNSTEVKREIQKPISHAVYRFGGPDEVEYYENILKSVNSTQIKVFSTIPLSKLPNDMASLKETIGEEFPNALKQFNEGQGLPLQLQLRTFDYLDPNYEEFENRLSERNLEEIEFMFDDLLETKAAISDWVKTMVKPLTEEQEQKIGDLYHMVEDTLKAFHEIIGTLGLSQGVDPLEKAKEAYDAYKEDDYVAYGHEFYRKYRNLRKVMEKEQEEATKK